MDCFQASTRPPTRTINPPGTMTKVERLKPPAPPRPPSQTHNPVRPAHQLHQEMAPERIQKKAVKAVVIRRLAERALRGRADRNLRQCCRQTSLTIFRYSIRVQFFNC